MQQHSGGSERIKQMTQRITNALHPNSLEIIDNSQAHHGHKGEKEGKGHFTIHIACNKFKGKTRIEQHQMVYTALGDMLTNDIHALNIKVLNIDSLSA